MPANLEERDSFYINVPDTVVSNLTVISNTGCISTAENIFVSRLPEAYFLPDLILGFEMLTVTFTDLSLASEEIVRKEWLFDDGEKLEVDPSVLEVVHTYDTCGLYYPKLVIETISGCIDTSTAIEIDIFGCVNPPSGGGGDPDPEDPTPSNPPDLSLIHI